MLVAMRAGGTPVPIPNTKVKTCAADGTALETVWESRWLPAQKKKTSGSWRDRTAWSGPCDLYQQGNAVAIAGFTSDPSRGRDSWVRMTDKTSVKKGNTVVTKFALQAH